MTQPIRYAQYRPTAFDHHINIDTKEGTREDWLVLPVIRTRDDHDSTDNGRIALSNFAAALARLGGESDTVEVHSFNHWGPGWFEIILAHPQHEAAVIDMMEALENYPLLDEDDYCRREYEAINEAWDNMDHEDRVTLLHSVGADARAARRNSPWRIETRAGDWPYQLIRN